VLFLRVFFTFRDRNKLLLIILKNQSIINVVSFYYSHLKSFDAKLASNCVYDPLS